MRGAGLAVGIAACFLALPPRASAQWWNPFAPADFEECSEEAAKEAKTNGALRILLQVCNAKFPARRNPNGTGYRLYDSRLERYFQIDGPTPTAQEVKRMDKAYREYLVQKRQDEQRRAVEEQARAEREAHRRAEEKRKQGERKAATLPNVQIVESKLGCKSGHSCMSKYGTVVVKNTSAETITRIDLGWTVFFQGNDRSTPCPSNYETKKSARVRIPPGTTASFDFQTLEGPDSAFRLCIKVNDIEIGAR